MRLLKYTALFTLSGILLGVAAAVSPQVHAFGWLLGTMLSVFAGAAYGMTAGDQRAAIAGGAFAGAVPILVGCGLGTALGDVPPSALLQAVVVGFIVGAGGSTFAFVAAGETETSSLRPKTSR